MTTVNPTTPTSTLQLHFVHPPARLVRYGTTLSDLGLSTAHEAANCSVSAQVVSQALAELGSAGLEDCTLARPALVNEDAPTAKRVEMLQATILEAVERAKRESRLGDIEEKFEVSLIVSRRGEIVGFLAQGTTGRVVIFGLRIDQYRVVSTPR